MVVIHLRLGLTLALMAAAGACTDLPIRPPCPDCNALAMPGPPFPAVAPGGLTTLHRSCGLDDENVSTDGFVFLPVAGTTEAQLQCLARGGDHEAIGEYANALVTSDEDLRPQGWPERAYRWSMVALRNYLNSVGVNFDDPDFFEQYARLGREPGLINVNGPSDRIYYYSAVARGLLDDGRVTSSPSDIMKLRIIASHYPGY